jgi:hypothetical protein
MCVVSMVGRHYEEKWVPRDWFPEQPRPGRFPPIEPVQPAKPDFEKMIQAIQNMKQVSRQEFEALKQEVEELKLLLQRAIEYDEKNNEPHCENEAKMELLRAVAKAVGIDLDEVIGAAKAAKPGPRKPQPGQKPQSKNAPKPKP